MCQFWLAVQVHVLLHSMMLMLVGLGEVVTLLSLVLRTSEGVQLFNKRFPPGVYYFNS